MSVAFTREESAETAAEGELPDRPISPHPNWVTASGRGAVPPPDIRYFADLLRTARVFPPPAEFSAVAFGHRVAFRRDDGRLQAFRIVGEDEADPRNGSISYVSPVARALIGRAAGEIVLSGDHEIEILSI